MPPILACDLEDQFGDTVGKVGGFSLHDGVARRVHECHKLERLCRYISRRAVSEKRPSVTPNGNVRYQFLPAAAQASKPRNRWARYHRHSLHHHIVDPTYACSSIWSDKALARVTHKPDKVQNPDRISLRPFVLGIVCGVAGFGIGALRARLLPLGVHRRQARVLDALGRIGKASQVTLAKEFDLTAASMSTMTTRLLEAGLIERQVDEHELRSNVLRLSNRGRSLLETIYRAWQETDREISEAIGSENAEHLAYLTCQLRNALGGFTYALATALVFCIALVFSMLGLGGGMLYVPVFKWLELPFKTIAVPLSLLLNGVTTLSDFARYVREGLVDFRGGLPAALSALAMAPIGAHLMQYVPVHLLIILFAATTALAGLRSLTARQGSGERDSSVSPGKRLTIGIGVGSFEGFMGGLLGVGAGFIVAPILMELGYSPKRAAATTSFIVTFASASGFLAHAAEGRIEPLMTGLTLVAAIAGSQLGAWFMIKRARPGWVKRFYGVLLLAVAVKLLHGLST